MSNKTGDIDEIIGEKAFERVRLMVDELGRLRSVYTDTVKDITAGMKSMDNAASVKEVTTNVDNLATKTKKLNEVQTQFVETQSKVEKAFRTTGAAVTELDKQMVKAIQEANRWATEEKKTQASLGNTKKSIDQVKMTWKDLETMYKNNLKAARDIGVQYGVNSKQFKDVALATNSLRKEMDAINTTLGQHQANVGNYSSALKDVWGGLRQIAYILPGIGIAGLFNLAFEAITPLVDKINIFNDKAKDLNNVVLEGTKNATDEVLALDRLYKKTQDTTKSIEERKKAVDKLQELYPAYFANIKDENILNGRAASVYTDLRNTIIAVAQARSVEQKISEIVNDNLDEQLKLQQKVTDAQKIMLRDKGKGMSYAGQYGQGGAVGTMTAAEADVYRKQQVINAQNELNDFQTKLNKKLEIYTNFLGKVQDAEVKTGNDKGIGNKGASSGNKTTGKKTTGKSSNPVSFEPFANDDLQLMEKQAAERLEWYKKVLNEWANDPDFQASMEKLMPLKGDAELSDTEAERLAKDIAASLEKAAKKKRIKEAILGLLKESFDAFKEIASNLADIITITANRAADNQLKNIDRVEKAELEALERRSLSEKEKELQRKLIETEAEARRKKTEQDRVKDLQRAAKLQRAIDIAQIISNIALGVSKAYTTGDPYTASARAFLAAAAGAAQLAKVFATPLPQYAKGRKGGKAEFAVVNEQGAEVVQTKDGNAYIPNEGKKGVTFLPEGASVIPHHEAIKNAAFVKLQGNKVDSNNYANALIAAYLEGAEGIKEEIRKSKSNWNIYADTGVAIRYKSKIR